MDIIILGGGWAGIAAAITAVRNGAAVTLVEARPYLGGRARSFMHRDTRTVIDNGQHVMIGAYSAADSVLKTLGTDTILDKQTSITVAFVGQQGSQSVLNTGRLPGRAGLVTGILGIRHLGLTSKLAILKLAQRIISNPPDTTGLTCTQFLIRERQPNAAIGGFWDPIILATLNAPPEKAAASLLVNVLRLSFFAGTGASGLWIPTTGLSDLLSPFPDWLNNHHGTLITGDAVQLLKPHERGLGWTLTLHSGTMLNGARVISAIPQRALHRLATASNLTINLPAEPEVSPIPSVYLWYDTQWLSADFCAALGTTVQWIFNKKRIREGLVALTISAASIVPDNHDRIVQLCRTELESLFPESKHATIVHAQVIREKQATPLITPEIESARTSYFTRHQNHGIPVGHGDNTLWLAGDWTMPGLPATIEAAARSGIYAAGQACSRTVS